MRLSDTARRWAIRRYHTRNRPSIRQLAAVCGVSPSTMHRALSCCTPSGIAETSAKALTRP